jgi:hypothetical protein
MRSFSFSLLGLLLATTVAAVGCAVLARPGEWSASGLLTGTMAVLAGMGLAALYGCRERRAFRGGFALCGALYLLLVLGPAVGTQLGTQLPTSQVLAWAAQKWHQPAAYDAVSTGQVLLTSPSVQVQTGSGIALLPDGLVVSSPAYIGSPTGSTWPPVAWTYATTGAPLGETLFNQFHWAGQGLWALVCGTIGGFVAQLLRGPSRKEHA